MTENLQLSKLESYIEALRSIIYVTTFDFNAFDALIEKIVSKDRNIKVNEYNEGHGYVDFYTKKKCMKIDIIAFLNSVSGPQTKQQFILLKDMHRALNDPRVISLLKTIALKNIKDPNYNVTVFIVSSVMNIPPELEQLITVFDAPLPTQKEIGEIIMNFSKANLFELDRKTADEFTWLLKGFTEFEIIQILNLAYQNSGSIDAQDKEIIIQEKEQNIKKSGILEVLRLDDSIEDVGGLYNLKEWLNSKAAIYADLDDAVKYGVDIPKGIMIVGMPGCGKSTTAKATAKLFGVPLVRLDVGNLMGKYVGESEANMRKAIRIAEAISPCVLWVDEIEKAFSGINQSGGSHEVTTRLFGSFLTWMQEKISTVFVVATSNDVSKLPPEFLRKGRFDEIFMVDFPNSDERKNIFEIHLKKRGKWSVDINIVELIKKTKDYSGADIESVVKNTIEKAYLNNAKNITTDDLLNEIEDTTPLSKALKEQIDEHREKLKTISVKKASS